MDTYLPTCLMYSTGCLSSSGSYSVLVPWSGGVSWVLLRPTSDLCCPTPGTRGRSSIHSSEQGLLFVPFARTSTTQARAFSVVGPLCGMGFLWHYCSARFFLIRSTLASKLLFSRARVGSASE